MKKYYYLKQSLKPLLMMSCFVLTVQQGVADTSVSREMLNVLSEEANNTKMTNKQVEDEVVKEEAKKKDDDPTTKATLANTAAGDDLSAKIESQLRRVLGKEGKAGKDDVVAKKDTDTDTELEKIVSSALLEGAKMDDIRSAVSDAMAEIKNDKDKKGKAVIAPERITEADKAFSKLTVTKKTPKPISADKTAPKVSTEQPNTITVQEGESLFKIALRIYGDGNKYYKLYKANEDQIKDPNMLLAGQVLIAPEF
jgi:nucleoid-associated protein YgaU